MAPGNKLHGKEAKARPGRTGKKPFSGPNAPMLAVAGLTLLVYLPALFNGFILWDDHSYTWENPFLRDFNFLKVFSFNTFFQGNYHPLTLLWLHLEWLIFPAGDPELFGGLNPSWFHANNILLHLVNTMLVFRIIRELTGGTDWKAAALAALLFGIHPMHVESVAWVAELKDVLYSLFYLAALLAYLRYLRERKAWQILLTFALFLLSCLSKGQAVTLPLVMLLADWYTGRRRDLRTGLEKIPFLVLSLFFGILAIRAQADISALDSHRAGTLGSVVNASYGLAVYLVKAVLPLNLSAVHPYPYTDGNFPFLYYLLPPAVLLLAAATLWSVRKGRDVAFGLLFFALTISVVIKLVPVGDSLVSERYSYLPYIGLFFLAGRGFSMAMKRKRLKVPVLLVTSLFCLVMIALSFQRIGTWKDTGTFWRDVSEKYPRYWRGHYGLGVLAYNTQDYETAFRHADLACRLQPPAAPYMLRGTLFLNHRNQPDSALADYRKVLTFREKGSPFELQARLDMAKIFNGRARYTESLGILDEAASLYPGDASVFLARGMLKADYLVKYEEAIADFNRVLELAPGQADAELGIGFCYYRMNRFPEAAGVFDRILQQRPDEGRVWYFRALVMAAQGRFADALADGQKAVQAGFKVNEQELALWEARAGR